MSTTIPPLIENAFDFIENATNRLANSDSNSLEIKYTILHLSSGLELLLKQPLVDQHWSLIFSNVDKASKLIYESGEFSSINIESIEFRLKGIHPLKTDDIRFDKVKELRKLRNRIEHFSAPLTKEQVVTLVFDCCNVAINLIDKFEILKSYPDIQEEYDSIIKNILKLEEFTKNRMEHIKPEIQEFESKNTIVIKCPRCHQTALPLYEDPRKCLFCKNSYDLEELPELWVEEFQYRTPQDELADPSLKECKECHEVRLLFMEMQERWICFNCEDSWLPSEISVCEICGTPFESRDYFSNECNGCLMNRFSD